MNIAIIFAGGLGQRLNNGENSTPKQFLKINDKPIIIRTLELFQTHKDIDKIYIFDKIPMRILYEKTIKRA